LARTCDECGAPLSFRNSYSYRGRALCGACVAKVDPALSAAALAKSTREAERLPRSALELVLGVLALFAGAALLAFAVALLTDLIGGGTPAQMAYRAGGLVMLGGLGVLCTRWAAMRFHAPLTVSHAVARLLSPSASVRWSSLRALQRVGWEPTTGKDRVSLLLASGKWEAAASCGLPMIEQLIATLSWEPHHLDHSLPLLARLGDRAAVESLIALLGKERARDYRGKIVQTLQAITGARVDDTYSAWCRWLEDSRLHESAQCGSRGARSGGSS
jgi:hypothetical protein